MYNLLRKNADKKNKMKIEMKIANQMYREKETSNLRMISFFNQTLFVTLILLFFVEIVNKKNVSVLNGSD